MTDLLIGLLGGMLVGHLTFWILSRKEVSK